MAKRGTYNEVEIRSWLAKRLKSTEYSSPDLFLDESKELRGMLRSGEALCYLFNTLMKAKYIRTIHNSNLAFKKIENISQYLEACSKIKDFNQVNLFQSLDLYERVNMDPILRNITRLKTLAEENNNDISSLLSTDTTTAAKQSPIRNFSPSVRKPRPQTFSPSASPSTLSPAASASTSPSVVSLQDDIATKKEFKFSRKLEQLALKWLLDFFKHYRTKLTKPYPVIDDPNISLYSLLQSGELLCELANILHTMIHGSIIVPKINHSRIPFLCMENIGFYVKSAHLLGVQSSDIFEAPDLFEQKNMNIVITHFHVLAKQMAKTVVGYDGPLMENTSQVKTLWSQSLTFSDEEEKTEIPEELTKEQTELLEWLNQKLSTSGIMSLHTPITSISNGLRSGEVLIELLCVLTKQNDLKQKAQMNPTTLWHRMQNSSLILNYITEQTFHQVEGCKPQDIVLGDTDRISRLLAFLRDKFDLDFLFIRMMNEGLEDPNQVITFKDLEQEIRVDASPRRTPTIKERKKKKSRSERRKRTSLPSVSTKKTDNDSSVESSKSRRKSKRTSSEELKPKSKSRREKRPKADGTTEQQSTTSDSKKPSKRRSSDGIVPSPKPEKHSKREKSRSPRVTKRKQLTDSRQLLRNDSINGKALERARIEKAQLAVRQRIVQELYDTEIRYVEGLQCLCSRLLVPVKNREILSPNDYLAIFDNVESILAYHHSLLGALKKEMVNYSNSSPIAEIFLKSCQFFGEYGSYLSNYSTAIVMLFYIKQRNEEFCKMLSDWEVLEEVTLSSISSYLVMPIQRLPRYILLFKDMIKYTPETHCDTEILLDVVDYIQNTLNNMNKGINKEIADQNSKLLSVFESIEGADMLVVPKRTFIMESKVRFKQKGKALSNLLNRKSHAFLFSDYLVVCEQYDQPKGTKLYECQAQVSLVGLQKDDISWTDDNISVRADDAFTIKPVEAEDTKIWVQALQQLAN